MKRSNIFLTLVITLVIFTSCEKDSGRESIDTEPIVFKKEGELSIVKSSGEVIKQLDIEVADNNFERETGLMHRESMQDNHGMLFIFEEAAPRFFYMKNTLIPLDIVYFGSDSTAVSFQLNAKPKDLTPLPSEEPAQFVLEVNAGLVEEWNVEIGDKIDFEILPSELHRDTLKFSSNRFAITLTLGLAPQSKILPQSRLFRKQFPLESFFHGKDKSNGCPTS